MGKQRIDEFRILPEGKQIELPGGKVFALAVKGGEKQFLYRAIDGRTCHGFVSEARGDLKPNTLRRLNGLYMTEKRKRKSILPPGTKGKRVRKPTLPKVFPRETVVEFKYEGRTFLFRPRHHRPANEEERGRGITGFMVPTEEVETGRKFFLQLNTFQRYRDGYPLK